jgi:hypothetical protein
VIMFEQLVLLPLAPCLPFTSITRHLVITSTLILRSLHTVTTTLIKCITGQMSSQIVLTQHLVLASGIVVWMGKGLPGLIH